MASRSIIMRGRAPKISLDLPMASLAALSVAFATFTLPDTFFTQAVGATGLASFLPSAQPPLGMTARLSVVLAAGAATFIFIWLVLRALGGEAAVKRPIPERDETESFILRRADSHPDAPSRRPLFAGRELGEPDQPAPDQWERDQAPQRIRFGESEVFDIVQADHETPAEAAEILPELTLQSPAAETPELVEQPAWEMPAPLSEVEEASITQLVQRFERGMHRRKSVESAPLAAAPVSAPPAPAPAAPAPMNDPVDERLRTALDHLQKMAARPS